MRAWAVVESGADLQDIEMPTPEPTGTEVLLEVTHCGVCHSDLHIWDGYYDMGGGNRMSLKERGVVLPLALGHEIVGRVAKLGPDAAALPNAPKVGDTRIVFPWVGCGTCDMCLAEEDNMCLTGRALGVFQNGGYGSHVVAPHPRHLIDPGTLDPALAATYACSGVTVYSAIAKVMPLKPTDAVVVVGAGGLGLAAIGMLRAMGHERVIAVDVDEAKLAGAREAGASETVDGRGPDVTARLLDAAGGPVRAVIDLVNGTATAAFAIAALRKGGKLVQVGLFGGEMRVPLPAMAMRALTIQGSYVGNPKELREVVALAQSGKLQPLPIEELPRDRANEALHRLKDGKVRGRLVLVAA